MAEKPALTKYFKGDIFFTFNNPKFKILQPELPTVYWYSIKKGVSEKPWFMK